jgi:hypothetical protein
MQLNADQMHMQDERGSECSYKMNAVQMYSQGEDVCALKPQVEETRLLLTIQLCHGRPRAGQAAELASDRTSRNARKPPSSVARGQRPRAARAVPHLARCEPATALGPIVTICGIAPRKPVASYPREPRDRDR